MRLCSRFPPLPTSFLSTNHPPSFTYNGNRSDWRRGIQKMTTMLRLFGIIGLLLFVVIVIVNNSLSYAMADETVKDNDDNNGINTTEAASYDLEDQDSNNNINKINFNSPPLSSEEEEKVEKEDETGETGDTEGEEEGEEESSDPLRILYIVTTLAEYNTGDRATVKGSDRLQLTLIPVLREGVESMLRFGYHVDVYLICHYELLPERFQLVRNALPSSVNVNYWDDATPLGYSLEHDVNRTQHITRALARQHRFVIKEKLLDYDLFVNFEDDMLIKGDHVQQFLHVTHELYQLREEAPEHLPNDAEEEKEDNDEKGENSTKSSLKRLERRRNEMMNRYTGPMNKAQLSRMLPGFIRVEALLEENVYGAQEDTGPVAVNLTVAGASSNNNNDELLHHVDPRPCCHVSPKTVNVHMPATPSVSQLFLWETNILALGVRQMPKLQKAQQQQKTVPKSPSSGLDWVVMQRGPLQDRIPPHTIIGDYWSGRDGYFRKEKRPIGHKGNYVNNQGGWMATRRQILEWHTQLCPGGFLPPFEAPHYRMDGLDLRNVEYWSGGLNIVTYLHACNLQRIIPIHHPQAFSRHLIYHTANNKQRQLKSRRKHFTKVDTLLGQLNTIRHNAEQALLTKAAVANGAVDQKEEPETSSTS